MCKPELNKERNVLLSANLPVFVQQWKLGLCMCIIYVAHRLWNFFVTYLRHAALQRDTEGYGKFAGNCSYVVVLEKIVRPSFENF